MQMVKQFNRNMLKETEDKFLEQNKQEDVLGVPKVCHAGKTIQEKKTEHEGKHLSFLCQEVVEAANKVDRYRITYLVYI
jgi:hypothetical protein